MEKGKSKLSKLREKIEGCEKCNLSKSRNNIVIGDGSPNSNILFIGEAPGKEEDLKGVPFVGKAGEMLDELLKTINLKREEVYITNVVLCHPPNNRDPKPEEIEKCTPYLDKQIEIIKPKLICTLGNFATRYILEKYGLEAKSIGKIHGKVFSVGEMNSVEKIIPMYHPAVATYNPNMKDTLKKDFQKIRNYYKT